MKLTMKSINGLSPAMRSNSSAMLVDCDMTEQQMFDALSVFLEHVTDQTFQEWLKKLKVD